jgi:ribosome-binding protein aMBF1 (putative translation factor)
VSNRPPKQGRPAKDRPSRIDVSEEERKAHQLAFGRRLKEQRELRGWSTKDLAITAGLTAAGIRTMEAGAASPLTWTVELLARALSCSAGWLAFGQQESSSAT